jgi:hypothetical protein
LKDFTIRIVPIIVPVLSRGLFAVLGISPHASPHPASHPTTASHSLAWTLPAAHPRTVSVAGTVL